MRHLSLAAPTGTVLVMNPNLAVARRSPSPSGGAREQARDGASPIGPVILATEFGAVSVGAERVAVRMARDAGVSLVVVHAIDVGRLRLPGGRFRQRVDQARAAREHDAEAMLRRVETAGFRPQVLIWEGDPAICVLDAARAEGASRIVVGSHGRGRLGRALVGSVSAVIASRADRPVHIVRSDGGREDIVTVSPAAPG